MLTLAGTSAQGIQAIQASPAPFLAIQPDGTEIVLFLRGDEHFHWEEDENGYTVLLVKGRYVYAEQAADGHLVPTPHEVGKTDPAAIGLPMRALPSPQLLDATADPERDRSGSKRRTTAPEDRKPPDEAVTSQPCSVPPANPVKKTIGIMSR